MNDLLTDVQEIFCEVINRLIAVADKHNYDRDDVIKKFAVMFDVLADITTFKEYEVYEKRPGFYDYLEGEYFEVRNITHWMPLPDPPKGETE